MRLCICILINESVRSAKNMQYFVSLYTYELTCSVCHELGVLRDLQCYYLARFVCHQHTVLCVCILMI